MGDGLSQYVLLIVTLPELCAFVEKAQNIQIVLWQRHAGFKWSKYSQIPNMCFMVFLFYPEHHEPQSLCCLYFSLPSEPGGPKLTDWSKADLDNIFTTNGSKPGWCNVDPDAAYASKVLFKEECDCKYDGLWGGFCEVPVESVCINQCSGHGHCRGGFCQVIALIFCLFLLIVGLICLWKEKIGQQSSFHLHSL